jgi:L-ascorbate metabolism protein UlaG (beta-lactamase superfamily)
MKRSFLLVMVLAALSAVAAEDSKPVSLTWYGQACFLLKSPGGTTILLDPYSDKIGYKVPSLDAQVVLITHEHFDHNNSAMAKAPEKVIHGLDADGNWVPVSETFGDVKVRSVGVYHDDKEGKDRGKDTVFILETGGKTIVHLGDLGHLLSDEQVKAIGRVDVLLIPIGGVYTIDADAAQKVVAQLNPKIVVPMHYKTDPLSIPLAKPDKFLSLMTGVEKTTDSTLTVGDLPGAQKVIVLVPKQ